MKKFFKSLMLVLAVCTALVSGNISIVKAEKYGYTVTIFSGNQASITNASAIQIPSTATVTSVSKDKIVITNLQYGDMVSCNGQDAVSLSTDSKYYVKGIRLSGRDNNTVAYSSFSVYGDQDYVIAYGIKGEVTSYVVNYLDENGNSLAESKTYYGNVGDKPVIAYLYIDGYSPSSYNISKALVSNSADNIFNFVYIANSKPNTNQTGEDVDNPSDDTNSPNGNDTNQPDADNTNQNDDDNDSNGDDNNAGNNNAGNGGNDNNGTGNTQTNTGDNNNTGAGETTNNDEDPGQVTNVPGEGNEDSTAEPAPDNTINDQDVPLNPNDNDDVIEIDDNKIPLFRLLFEDGLIFPIVLGLIAVIVFVIGLIMILKKKNKPMKETSKSIEVENLDKEDKN